MKEYSYTQKIILVVQILHTYLLILQKSYACKDCKFKTYDGYLLNTHRLTCDGSCTGTARSQQRIQVSLA